MMISPASRRGRAEARDLIDERAALHGDSAITMFPSLFESALYAADFDDDAFSILFIDAAHFDCRLFHRRRLLMRRYQRERLMMQRAAARLTYALRVACSESHLTISEASRRIRPSREFDIDRDARSHYAH